VTWLRLDDATAVIDHDEKGAAATRPCNQQGLAGATWRPAARRSQCAFAHSGDAVTWFATGGQKLVLHWETSEIECLCKAWTPSSQPLASAAPTQSRAKIEVWDEDLVRLMGS
jgi:hypothetical protein